MTKRDFNIDSNDCDDYCGESRAALIRSDFRRKEATVGKGGSWPLEQEQPGNCTDTTTLEECLGKESFPIRASHAPADCCEQANWGVESLSRFTLHPERNEFLGWFVVCTSLHLSDCFSHRCCCMKVNKLPTTGRTHLSRPNQFTHQNSLLALSGAGEPPLHTTGRTTDQSEEPSR